MANNEFHIHGGSRPGAGAPLKLATQLDKAEKLTKKLSKAIKLGLRPLAKEYPGLIKQAIDMAKAGDKQVLLHLIDLLPRMVRVEDDEQGSKASQVFGKILAQIKVEGDLVVVKGGNSAEVSP